MSEELDPSKFHVLTNTQKRQVTLLIFVFVLIIVPSLGYFYYNFAVNRPAQTDKETMFEIKKGEHISDISSNLYKQGLINSRALFSLYVIINKFDKNIQAGVYNIKAGASIIDLLESFKHGTNDIRITFIEGYRVEEIARTANQKFDNVDYEAFLKIAKQYEGYLFPDTYFLNANITEAELIDTLKSTFDEKTKDILTPAALEKVGLTKEQAVILASIVEREVPKDADRLIVAEILIKRFKSKELLGADATVQYVVASLRVGCALTTDKVCPSDGLAQKMNWWPKDLSQSDLEIDSPFNTRKNPGLPPTPISSPGLSAIKAVTSAQSVPYNYYLTDKDGVVRYAKTLEEHNVNIRKYIF